MKEVTRIETDRDCEEAALAVSIANDLKQHLSGTNLGLNSVTVARPSTISELSRGIAA